MKQLTCEMCGGTNMLKQDGVFVCQNCGTKYTVEEARKMMIEGTVEVKGKIELEGTVKLDHSEELKNLFEVARRAAQDSIVDAEKYYEKITQLSPDNWEAVFYINYAKSINEDRYVLFVNGVDAAMELVKNNIDDQTEQENAINEMFSNATRYSRSIHRRFMSLRADALRPGIMDSQLALKYTQRAEEGLWIIYGFEEALNKSFPEGFTEEKIMVLKEKRSQYCEKMEETKLKSEKNRCLNIIKCIDEKIKEYDPTYEIEDVPDSSGGCYVATCVYGSYDCPQVWTLRRYRDNTLASTWYGRAFIHTYYAISPTIVKWFGNTEWFKKMWKGKLDRMVEDLQSNGVENTPYEDKKW